MGVWKVWEMLGLLSRLIMLLNFEYVPVKCLITSHMKWKWSNHCICASFIATVSSLAQRITALFSFLFFNTIQVVAALKNVYNSIQINSVQQWEQHSNPYKKRHWLQDIGYNGHDLGTLKVLEKVPEKLYEFLHPCETQSHFDFHHSLKQYICVSTD